jgi:hypothetical protein
MLPALKKRNSPLTYYKIMYYICSMRCDTNEQRYENLTSKAEFNGHHSIAWSCSSTVEHLSYKQRDAGSSPAGTTNIGV